MTRRNRKLLTKFLAKYWRFNNDEILCEEDIMYYFGILIIEEIVPDIRSLQIAIGRETGILIPENMIIDAIVW